MATNSTLFNICDLRHISKPASHWCPVCDEALCDDCNEHHGLAKATRDHKVIPFEDYEKLSPSVTQIKLTCPDHDESYQLYCRTHESCICLRCVKTHNTCNDIVPLDEVVKDIKTSQSFQELKQSLDDLVGNIVAIEKDRQTNIASIKVENENLKEELKQRKEDIIRHLNIVEGKLAKQLDDCKNEAERKLQNAIPKLNEKKKELNNIQGMLSDIVNHASDIHTFLSMKEMEVKIGEVEKFIQSLFENDSLNRVRLSYTMQSNIQSFVNDIKSFGQVKIITEPTKVSIRRMKDKQAQLLTTPRSKSIGDIKIEFLRKISSISNLIRGCCIMSDGTLLLSYHKKNILKIFKSDGMYVDTVSFSDFETFDVTCMDTNTAVVSSGSSARNQGLKMIDIPSRKEIRYVALPEYTYGVTYSSGSVLCAVHSRGIYKVGCDDYTPQLIVKNAFQLISYITAFKNQLYYTDSNKSRIVCCDVSGTTIWETKTGNCLDDLKGIATDNFGNIYVVGGRSCNVVVFSPDGSEHREILTKQDGLVSPSAIFVDNEKKLLFVSNLDGFAFLFNLS